MGDAVLLVSHPTLARKIGPFFRTYNSIYYQKLVAEGHFITREPIGADEICIPAASAKACFLNTMTAEPALRKPNPVMKLAAKSERIRHN